MAKFVDILVLKFPNAITDSQTVIPYQIVSGSEFPDLPFELQMWDKETHPDILDVANYEILTVTNYDANNLTVTRPSNKSLKASNSLGLFGVTAKTILDIYTAISEKANSNDVYIKSQIDTKLATLKSEILNGSPAALDTLYELATALGNDPNFSTTVLNQIGNKVDKVADKGLSTNDFTNELKAQYDGKKTDNVSVISRILGRKTTGAGAIEELTVDEVLNFIGTPSANQNIRRNAGNTGYEFYTPASGVAGKVVVRTAAFLTESTAADGIAISGLSFSVLANKKYLIQGRGEFNPGGVGNTTALRISLPDSTSISGHSYSINFTGNIINQTVKRRETIGDVSTMLCYGENYFVFEFNNLIETVNDGNVFLRTRNNGGLTAGVNAGIYFAIQEVQ